VVSEVGGRCIGGREVGPVRCCCLLCVVFSKKKDVLCHFLSQATTHCILHGDTLPDDDLGLDTAVIGGC
jgi:hypothetical protein